MPLAKGSSLAFDRDSVRTVDGDGHMHIASSVISAAQVNDYLCEEIPGWEQLGLTPGRAYALLRDPLELEKGAGTFHGKPLLIVHRAQTAGDHDREVVVGSVNNPVWDAPNIKAELTIWDAEAIKLIESGEQKDLSSGYRYIPVMQPGEYNGVKFDGRMTEIEANHVALVSQGRVIGAVVGDSAISKETMDMPKTVLSRKAAVTYGAVIGYLRPRMATDAKLNLASVFKDVTAKNWTASKPAIIAEITKLATPRLAKDAKLDDMHSFIDSLDKEEPAEDDASSAPPMAAKDEEEKKRDFLKSKLSEDDMEAYDAMCEGQEAMDAEEDDEEEKKKKEAEAKDKRAKDAKDKAAKDKAAKDGESEKMDKKAMDAAITKAVADATPGIAKAAHDAAIKTQREIRDAEEAIRPHVGKLAMAHDSAEAVYRTALTALGEKPADVKDLPIGALRMILKRIPVPGAPPLRSSIAMDAAGVSSFKELFPDAHAVVRL